MGQLRDAPERTASAGARVLSSGTPAATAFLVGGALVFLVAVRKGFRGAVVKL